MTDKEFEQLMNKLEAQRTGTAGSAEGTARVGAAPPQPRDLPRRPPARTAGPGQRPRRRG